MIVIMDFQVFSKWYEENYIEGFQLDKDIITKGNRVYGPTTCKFVSIKDNAAQAHAKDFILTSPEGVVHKVHNLKDFAALKGLVYKDLHRAMNRNANKSYKGWRIEPSLTTQCV